MAHLAKPRLLGLCLNDIGPRIERVGLERISASVGRPPSAPDLATFATRLAAASPEFQGVPPSRWLEEATRFATVTPDGLRLTYDPALREGFVAAMAAPDPDLCPLFDALTGLPVALIRGANSDLLSMATVTEMQARRPDLIFANVPGRGHIPYLDEPESLTVLHAFLKAIA
jgi:pimeloyl-ACP methyl ester carboxylesterase